MLRNPATGEAFAARVDELAPPSAVVQTRAKIFGTRLFSEALLELKDRAEAAMKVKGY